MVEYTILVHNSIQEVGRTQHHISIHILLVTRYTASMGLAKPAASPQLCDVVVQLCVALCVCARCFHLSSCVIVTLGVKSVSHLHLLCTCSNLCNPISLTFLGACVFPIPNHWASLSVCIGAKSDLPWCTCLPFLILYLTTEPACVCAFRLHVPVFV